MLKLTRPGEPSDAIFKAFAKVPMKVMAPNVEHDDSLPFDLDELTQMIEKEIASP
jgi:hypothetical protein